MKLPGGDAAMHTTPHLLDVVALRLPFVKLGKYVRIDRAGLREYIDAKRQASRSAVRRR